MRPRGVIPKAQPPSPKDGDPCVCRDFSRKERRRNGRSMPLGANQICAVMTTVAFASEPLRQATIANRVPLARLFMAISR